MAAPATSLAAAKSSAAAENLGGGTAEFFLGPMFSGKTTRVLQMLRRARLAGHSVVFVKSAKDVRYGAGPASRTHDGAAIEAEPATEEQGGQRVLVARNLLELRLAAGESVVGVDEGQFFPDLPEAVAEWTRRGLILYVAALDGDFRRRPFGRVLEALPFASHFEKLSAVCMLCAAAAPPRRIVAAPFTLRVAGGGGQELIGAKDKYRAACLSCYLRACGAPE
jgi:thymidine kinase